ncbi:MULTISPECIES: YrhK family protein [unclassified Phaeobacter]|uniref:YrhK family protein n=2 Tax=Roseobacteraceae TaxID=2854170 RepID=UPI003A852156
MMALFHPDNRNRSDRHKKIYAYCEIAYTMVDVSAAVLFVIGSILFFNDATVTPGTWLFLVGSILFGLRPTIKLYREYAYLRLGDYDDITRQ